MIKNILTILLCQISFFSFSQEYHPMIVEGNQWNVMTKYDQGDVTDPEDYWFTTKYTVGEKIIQKDTVYHEIVNEKGERAYLVREDIESRKVYLDNQLMYDFSLQVNDTISNYNDFGDLIYILRLDSIKPYEFENGTLTRIFHFSYGRDGESFSNFNHRWVEGMGSPRNGLDAIRPILTGNGPYQILLCFKNKDNSLFTNSDYKTCDENSTANLDVHVEEVSIYPNPTSNSIHIDLSDSNNSMVRIIDILGKIVYEKQRLVFDEKLDIDVSNLDKGLYIISLDNVSNGENQYYVGQFIVE